MVNLNQSFTNTAIAARQAAAAFTAAGDLASAEKYTAMADKAEAVAGQTADMELDCEQSGWGVTPIIGADFKKENGILDVKYEFNTKLNVEIKQKEIFLHLVLMVLINLQIIVME